MSSTAARAGFAAPHPLQAILLGGIPLLLLGAVLSDLAYSSTFHIQWANFASWLVAGALVVGGIALLWAIVDLVRSDALRRRRRLIQVLLLLVVWVVGFVNALVHARDAWATMPEGLYLSVITALLALVAAWMGFSRTEHNEVA